MAPSRTPPPPPPPPPPGKRQRPQQRSLAFRHSAASRNGVHKPRARPSRSARALSDQNSEFKRFLASKGLPSGAADHRSRDGLPKDHCFRCGESHPWPDKDGTLYHTKVAPFWVKPLDEATNESSSMTALPAMVRTEAHLSAPTPAAPVPTQLASPATTPLLSHTPQTAHAPQDSRSYFDRMSDAPGGFEDCMAEYRRRDRAMRSDEERMQLWRSWYVPPDRQDEGTRGTHGANEDHVWK